MKPTCLVLRPGVSPDQVQGVLKALGLQMVEVFRGDGQRLSDEEVWALPGDQRQVVAHVADPLVNLSYLAIRGEHAEQRAAELHARIPSYTPLEALTLARAAANHDDQVRAIYRIAVLFPAFDVQAFEVFRSFGVDAQNPLLREATVDAMVYRCWPEFVPLLERISGEDAAETVRCRAADVLPHLRAASAPK